MKQEFEACSVAERPTLPPPSEGITFTLRSEWSEPIGQVDAPDMGEAVTLFTPTAAIEAHILEPMLPIDAEDAQCPAMLLAWAHMLQQVDPFYSESKNPG